jgi:hypothetical protein
VTTPQINTHGFSYEGGCINHSLIFFPPISPPAPTSYQGSLSPISRRFYSTHCKILTNDRRHCYACSLAVSSTMANDDAEGSSNPVSPKVATPSPSLRSLYPRLKASSTRVRKLPLAPRLGSFQFKTTSSAPISIAFRSFPMAASARPRTGTRKQVAELVSSQHSHVPLS